MACVTVDIDPGEELTLHIVCLKSSEEGPEDGDEDEVEEDEYQDETGTGGRIYPIRAVTG